ncbi:DUF6584 family protein [Streptomyces sp. BE303]|uniref:DUF6584 family protein n=1 Tax=Streptomyces sp. BE303 TaxID=3002528 RepID=UPI002E75BE65|nr:DUF6584 family protein [Streptomyces sp. BE303]MED7949589.1 hypothetical protein [Streptomyces sp. BE303]
MTVEKTLANAEADLRAGRVPMARQRLRGLVSSCPTDLQVRCRLGEVYRLYGDAAQAGRWTYLQADRDPDETAAFEARYPHPVARMTALAWRGPEDVAATDIARTRLTEVRESASDAAGRPLSWGFAPSDGRETEAGSSSAVIPTVGCTAVILVVLVLVLFVVLGAVSFISRL